MRNLRKGGLRKGRRRDSGKSCLTKRASSGNERRAHKQTGFPAPLKRSDVAHFFPTRIRLFHIPTLSFDVSSEVSGKNRKNASETDCLPIKLRKPEKIGVKRFAISTNHRRETVSAENLPSISRADRFSHRVLVVVVLVLVLGVGVGVGVVLHRIAYQ